MWTILKNGKKSKPIAEPNIHDLIDAGKLSGSDLGWREGFIDWVPLSECPEFKAKFLLGKISIKPLAVSEEENDTSKEINTDAHEKNDESKNNLPNKTSQLSDLTLKANSLQVGLYYANLVWVLSLLGFLYFWWFFDPTISSELGGGRIMNLHGSSMKSNGMLGCSVLLIISSLYIMTYHVLSTLLRIERLLNAKERA